MARFSRLGEHGLGWHALAGALTAAVSRLSYPSAHAATSFAAARSLPLPRVVLHPVAAAMALSRLYQGVHYPTDTVAGAALGDAVAGLVP